MPDRPLKIAYLCDITPLDPNLYSGGNARMYNALQAHAGDVTILGQGWHLAEPLRRLMHALPEAINLRARWRLHLLLRRLIAHGVRSELKRERFDVLFCAYSFQSLAGFKPPYPMVTAFTADATPTTYKNSRVGQSFGSFLSVSRYFDPWVQEQERRVLNGADVLLWPTEWLKNGVHETHGALDAQTHVIPWGANIEPVVHAPSGPQLSKTAPVHLLFVGRDWYAKGGPVALEVMQALRARGVDARLRVVGVEPPSEARDPAMEVVAELDKSKPDEMALFAQLFRSSHFLINPSFESYGFAYCEASAYGLPSLSYRVGGVPVRDGINGHALPVESTADDFATLVMGYLDDPEAHDALRASAREEYETHLNWDSWGQDVATCLREAVSRL